MDNVEWGPWIYKGLPDLGDFVKVEARHEITHEFCVQTGIVTFNDGRYVCLDGKRLTYENVKWVAERWARGKLCDPIEEKRGQEAHA